MGISLAALGTYVGSFFTASGAAAAGTTAAAGAEAGAGAAAGAAAGGAAAGGAAAGTAAGLETVTVTAGAAAGGGAGAATLGGAAAAGAGVAAANGATPAAQPAPGHSIAKTVSEASAVASGASALYSLANGPGNLNIAPSPSTQGPTDQSVQNAEQQARAREAAAGGLQSTTGTSGGQQGAALNPSSLSSKSLLGG